MELGEKDSNSLEFLRLVRNKGGKEMKKTFHQLKKSSILQDTMEIEGKVADYEFTIMPLI